MRKRAISGKAAHKKDENIDSARGTDEKVVRSENIKRSPGRKLGGKSGSRHPSRNKKKTGWSWKSVSWGTLTRKRRTSERGKTVLRKGKVRFEERGAKTHNPETFVFTGGKKNRPNESFG